MGLILLTVRPENGNGPRVFRLAFFRQEFHFAEILREIGYSAGLGRLALRAAFWHSQLVQYSLLCCGAVGAVPEYH